jgi:hypothetical protein
MANWSTEYMREKFRQAVFVLATGEGDARSRVYDAHNSFLHIHHNDLPAELRAYREEIDHLLTRLGGTPGYIIPENLRRMKNKTASKIAGLIFAIYMGFR